MKAASLEPRLSVPDFVLQLWSCETILEQKAWVLRLKACHLTVFSASWPSSNAVWCWLKNALNIKAASLEPRLSVPDFVLQLWSCETILEQKAWVLRLKACHLTVFSASWPSSNAVWCWLKNALNIKAASLGPRLSVPDFVLQLWSCEKNLDQEGIFCKLAIFPMQFCVD